MMETLFQQLQPESWGQSQAPYGQEVRTCWLPRLGQVPTNRVKSRVRFDPTAGTENGVKLGSLKQNQGAGTRSGDAS